MRVTVYSRPGCHLCQAAIESLEELRSGWPELKINEINIEADDRLHRLYLERIPVVMVDDEVVSELVFDPGRFRDRLDSP